MTQTPKVEKKTRKETTLYAFWSKRENDIMYCYPETKRDGALLHYQFGPQYQIGHSLGKSLFQELDERGYDLSTFRFSIKKKVNQDALAKVGE